MLQKLLLGLVSSLLLGFFIRCILLTLRPTGFPPGPPTVPGIGNIHQIPTVANFLTFTSWSRQYGPVLGLKVGPKNFVVFHKASHVRSLWVQRGASYAARPRLAIASDYVFPHDYHRQVMFMTPQFHKIQRAATKHHLGTTGFEMMKPFQQAFAARLMNDLLGSPDDVRPALMRWGLGTPLYMIIGRRLEDMPKDWATNYLATQHEWVPLLDPSATPPVDIFPFLKWIPARFALWKRHAQLARRGILEVYSSLMDHAHQAKSNDSAGPSFESLVERLLRENRSGSDIKGPALSGRDMSFIAGGVMDAAFDTSYHTTLNLLKTLAAYPDVQKRIQAELDAVWGSATGVPECIDLEKLPYLNCCVLEVLRWRPTTPMSLPRRVMADDNFLGYRIPKDATALMNVWAIQHDPDYYDHPDEFDPERFVRHPLGIKTHGIDVNQEGRVPLYVFGAGRRACPGEQFAMNALKLVFAQLLRSYDIIADEKMDTSVETGFDAVFLLMTKPFKVRIVPRSEKAKMVVEEECRRANEFLKQAIA